MALLDYLMENGSLNIDEDHVAAGDIVYVSSLCTLAFFGTFGNIMILIMFSRKELSGTSYSIYIRAAAISDTIFMLMNMSENVMDHVHLSTSDPFVGKSYQFYIFWCVTIGTFRTTSPWIVVALAVDRCVAIWNPLHKTRYCTKKTAAIVMACIVLASFGVKLGLYILSSIEEGFYTSCTNTGLSVEMLMIKRLVTDTGVPCISMLIPNLLVIFKIQKSLSFRRTFSATNDQQEKVAKSVRPLLVVSCLAFITLLPISIREVVELSKMTNGTVDDYPNNSNDYNDFPNYGKDNNDYPNYGTVNDDYPIFANRDNSDHVFNFSNKTFETTVRSFDKSTDLIDSTNLGTDDVRISNSDLIESTSLGTDDVRISNSDLIESTSLGTDDERKANLHLIDSTSLGTDDVRISNSDLIESTSLGTNDERNMNSDLIESIRHESGDGQHDRMNSDDLKNQQEDGEDQTSEREILGNETVEGEKDNPDDENYQLLYLDTVLMTCNFIYMCNFAQNFYLLILSSSTYRNAIIKMFSCKCRKKKRDTPTSIG